MSTVRAIKVRGKDVQVNPVHRTVFKTRFSAEYAALEESEFAIPDTLHVSLDSKKVFFVDLGIFPAVYTWNGKKWVQVKP